MTETRSNNQDFNARRASKNASLLIFRSVITIAIGLITSRIIFNALGIEDYGINVVIAGILPAFTFVGGILATATSRFLTFEIGRGNKQLIRETFTATFYAHLALAIILVGICEVGGIYLLHHKLNIPETREGAAMIALQCAIIGVFFNITQAPYNAILIAREQFKIYAYVSLTSALYGLLSALLVKYTTFDKLIVYVILGFTNSVGCTLYLRYYCLRHYQEARIYHRIRLIILKPIITYTAWNLFGNSCLAIHHQSRNYLVNVFFGVTYNSSTSVATTVSGSVDGFTGPIQSAFSPSITKQYAQGNLKEMQRAMKTTLRFSLIVYAMIAIPLALNAELLFQLWLNSVPIAAPDVLRWILLASFFALMSSPLGLAIHATGKLQLISIIGGLYVLAQFFIIFALYSYYHNYLHAFVVIAMGNFFEVFQRAAILKKQLPQLSLRPLFVVNAKVISLVLFASIFPFILKDYIPNPILYLVITTLLYITTLGGTAFLLLLEQHERDIIRQYVLQLRVKIRDSQK